MNEPRRIVGTENSVRIDAQVVGDHIGPGAQIPVSYEVTNLRATPIAIADLVPFTDYDSDAHMFTVNIGSEVPGNEMLPRLIAIAPGEKKLFTTAVRVSAAVPPRPVDPTKSAAPAAFRVKVNFLGNTEPFEQLIGLDEKAMADAKLADALFPAWIEANEVVYTNTIPMRWVSRMQNDITGGREMPAPRRRRRG